MHVVKIQIFIRIQKNARKSSSSFFIAITLNMYISTLLKRKCIINYNHTYQPTMLHLNAKPLSREIYLVNSVIAVTHASFEEGRHALCKITYIYHQCMCVGLNVFSDTIENVCISVFLYVHTYVPA